MHNTSHQILTRWRTNVAYGTDLCQRVEAEGAALLMNENDALPLKEGAKVSTFLQFQRKYRLWWNRIRKY